MDDPTAPDLPDQSQGATTPEADTEALAATAERLRTEAAACAATGQGGFVVQVFADWLDVPYWVDHVDDRDGVDVPLAFATSEAAERYVDAVVARDHAQAHARWAERRDAWLPKLDRYRARRALLEAHGLWMVDGEPMQPLVVPAGPGPEPVRRRDGWRVVAYKDSDRYSFEADDTAARVLWCASCRGRVGIDVDCEDAGHEHRWTPYRRRRTLGTSW